MFSAAAHLRHCLNGALGARVVYAAQAGLSVSDYLLDLVRELVTRPTMAEIVTRAKTLARAGGGASRTGVQAAVRAGRDR